MKTVSTRAFPSRDDAHELQVYHDDAITVATIEVWEMDAIEGGPTDRPTIEDGAVYRIRSAASGKVLEVEGGSTEDGADVQQHEWPVATDSAGSRGRSPTASTASKTPTAARY